MSSSCLRPADLLRLLDGEATRNEEARFSAHLGECAACRQATSSLERLVADIAAPLPQVTTAGSADRVLLAIQRDSTRLSPPVRRRLDRWVQAAGLAAAVAAMVLVFGRLPNQKELFRARGPAPESGIGRRVGVTLYAPLAGHTPLRNGAMLSTQSAFSVTYRNLDEQRPVYLLVFGVDSAGDIHWLYPAYTERGSDPEAIRLPFSAAETALPDSVVLDRPAPGELRLVSVLAPQPLRVSAIESLARDQLTRAALQRRWPDSHIEDRTVTLRSDPLRRNP